MRKVILTSLIIPLCFVAAVHSHAATSLDTLIDTALSHNHDIVSASRAAESAHSDVDIRNLLPSPHFEIGWRGMPVDSFSNPTGTMYTISQSIPFPTKIVAQWNILSNRSEASAYRYDVAKAKLIAQIKSAYYKYIINDRLAQLEYNNYRFLEILYRSELKNYELGYSTQIDIIDVKTKLISASAAVQGYTTSRYNALAALTTLNAISAASTGAMHDGAMSGDMPLLPYDEADIDNIPHIMLSMGELKDTATKHNPLYRRLKYEMQAASAAAESAQGTYLPDISLAFSQMESSVPNMSERRLSVGMDLPWLWGGGVANSDAYREYLDKYAMYYMTTDEIMSGLEAAAVNLPPLYTELSEYKSMLPVIEKQMKQVNLGYATKYNEPKALMSVYEQFSKANAAAKNYYELYMRYIELAIRVEELTGERLW